MPSLAPNERSSPFARGATAPPAAVLATIEEMAGLAAAHGVELRRGPGLMAAASLNIVFIPPEFQPPG